MDEFLAGFGVACLGFIALVLIAPPEPQIKYIYDTEARLVGFCDGKYLIRTEEDEFPKDSCMFIEPIVWEGQV